METVVIAYLAAWSAGRVRELGSQIDGIGDDAAAVADRSLYELYRRLVARVPRLRQLQAHPDDPAVRAEAARDLRPALADRELRRMADHFVRLAESESRGAVTVFAPERAPVPGDAAIGSVGPRRGTARLLLLGCGYLLAFVGVAALVVSFQPA